MAANDINLNTTKMNPTQEAIEATNTQQPNHAGNQNQIRTFAQVTNENMFPKKDQAIIMASHQGLPIKEYILALGNLIGPNNILARDRISNNRIKVFLKSKYVVDELLSQHNSIQVLGQAIPIRRYTSTAQRIIISGGSPSVPHCILENYIKNIGLKLVSSISFLNANMNIDKYKHIISFNRQAYAEITNENQMPTSFLAKYDDEEFRFYIEIFQEKCYKCNKVGHKILNCPENQETPTLTLAKPIPIQTQESNETPITQTMPNPIEPEHPIIMTTPNLSITTTIQQKEKKSTELDTSASDTNEEEMPEQDNWEMTRTTRRRKRPPPLSPEKNNPSKSTQPKRRANTEENPSTSLTQGKETRTPKNIEEVSGITQSDSSTQPMNTEPENLTVEPINKEKPTSIEEMLTPVKPTIENSQGEYIFDYETLQKYIKDTKKKSAEEILTLTTKLSNNKNIEVYHMLDTLYPELLNPAIKKRFTQIKNIIFSTGKNTGSNTDTGNITD